MSELKQTDLSKRLRAMRGFGPEDFALLEQAAGEIERYYTGMLNWKATAEAKDREFAERRTQPEATAPAQCCGWEGHCGKCPFPSPESPVQDLSAAILAITANKRAADHLKMREFNGYLEGFAEARNKAAALASSANALIAGDRMSFIDNHKLHITTCYEEGDSQPAYEICIVHGDIEDDSLQCIGSGKSLREAIDAAILQSKKVGNHG